MYSTPFRYVFFFWNIGDCERIWRNTRSVRDIHLWPYFASNTKIRYIRTEPFMLMSRIKCEPSSVQPTILLNSRLLTHNLDLFQNQSNISIEFICSIWFSKLCRSSIYSFRCRSLSFARTKISANGVTNDYLHKSISRLVVVSIKFTFVQIISFLIDIENVTRKTNNQLTSFAGLCWKRSDSKKNTHTQHTPRTDKTMNSTPVECDNRRMKE